MSKDFQGFITNGNNYFIPINVIGSVYIGSLILRRKALIHTGVIAGVSAFLFLNVQVAVFKWLIFILGVLFAGFSLYGLYREPFFTLVLVILDYIGDREMKEIGILPEDSGYYGYDEEDGGYIVR